MHPLLQESIHWSKLYTSRLNDNVKLVGSAISCEGFHLSGDVQKPLRQNPHVQSYIVSTDQARMLPMNSCLRKQPQAGQEQGR
jgi:hypothetical protein